MSPANIPNDYVARLFDLTGRVAAVTGGGSGLGAAIAVGLSQAGARVAVLDLDEAGAGETAAAVLAGGGTAVALEVDVTSSGSVQSSVDDVLSHFGTVDILVNSAGIAYRCPAEDFPEEKLDAVLAVNLKGTYLCCQRFGRVMVTAGRGSIINMASIGSFVAYPMASAYLASKGGVVQLTRSLALEWHGRGVRVNAIAPTLMRSPMTDSGARQDSSTADFIIERMLERRFGEPQDLIGASVFLAGDASRLVTGHTIMCDDGYLIA